MKKKLSPTTSSNIVDSSRIESLYTKVSEHINSARLNMQRSIDFEMVQAYWQIGREIVEEEQHGEKRAGYGQAILKSLSKRLIDQYKKGFSVDTLEKARKFYLIYQEDTKSATLSRKSQMPNLMPNLSWSHYVELIKVSRPEAKQFYAQEASKDN